MANKHYFYVLHCKDDSFYGGYTTDPIRRLNEHNKGIGAKYTRLPSRLPAEMIHIEEFTTRSEASKAEYAFKKLSRKKKECYLKKEPFNKKRPEETIKIIGISDAEDI